MPSSVEQLLKDADESLAACREELQRLQIIARHGCHMPKPSLDLMLSNLSHAGIRFQLAIHEDTIKSKRTEEF
jgi:hypothetical protein